MKYIVSTLVLLFFSQLVFADSVEIPNFFNEYPKEIQAKFAKNGIKIDLLPNDRDKDSWAYLEYKGQTYFINTYEPITQEDFNVITRVIWDGHKPSKEN